MTVGKKLDQGKAPIIQGCLHYFPRALAEVSRCSEYGKQKYNTTYQEKNFLLVEDGFGRYTDGLGRHLAGEVIDEGGVDPESGILHAVMVAWNALARVEMLLKDVDDVKKEYYERRDALIERSMAQLHSLDQEMKLNQSLSDDKDISG